MVGFKKEFLRKAREMGYLEFSMKMINIIMQFLKITLLKI
jgi:hypothetical protein